MQKKIIGLFFSIITLFLISTTCLALDYTEIDYPGASGTFLAGINDSGKIVGRSTNKNNWSDTNVFVWDKNIFIPIEGFPDGAVGRDVRIGAGNNGGINNKGQVVGSYQECRIINPPYCRSSNRRGFTWFEGIFTPIDFPGTPDVVFPYRETYPCSINNIGQIVGLASGGGFVWENGNFSFPFEGAYSLIAINDSGQIVGSKTDGAAFMWDGEKLISLSSPNARSIRPVNLNNSGQIIGFHIDLTGNWYGFFWDKGVFTLIDLPNGTSIGDLNKINDKGQVVGSYDDENGTHGFLWASRVLTTIDIPNSSSTTINDINNKGQMVGSYFFSGGWHGFTMMAPVNIDTIPPTLAPVANQTILWPANNKMVPITIQANASDNSGLPVTLTATVSCNESGTGFWTAPVIDQASGVISLNLQAARAGNNKDGRQYTITITATDQSGNTNTANVKIVVPHDKGK